MREILFRGKRVDNGKWAFGNLIKNTDCSFIAEPVEYSNIGYCGECGVPFPECFEVIPETVGQFTGLTDKNGSKVFEGDICKTCGKNYLVIWDEYCWNLKDFYQSYYDYPTMAFSESEIQVIGNIHDNPDLLKPDEQQLEKIAII